MSKYDSKGRISSLGQQFMPITQLKGMQSGDFSSMDVEGVTSRNPETHLDQYEDYTYDWHGLRRDIANHGLTEPLVIAPAREESHPGPHTTLPARPETLLNGHHRAAVAQEQGHMFVPYTHKEPADWSPKTYRSEHSRSAVLARPNRTWEPLLQEHETEADQAHAQRQQHVAAAKSDWRQGQLFSDRRH